LVCDNKHVTLITGLCFQFGFASHIQILLVRHPTSMFHHSSRSSIPIDLCTIHSMYPHMKPYIYRRQKQKFRTISFRFAALLHMCDAMIHRSCLALLDRWALRVNLAHFLDVYNPKIVNTGTFTWIYL
jgi:hypothetical protein